MPGSMSLVVSDIALVGRCCGVRGFLDVLQLPAAPTSVTTTTTGGLAVSLSAMSWALKLDVPPTQKLVLVVLADHANTEGECFPSIASLAACLLYTSPSPRDS